MQQLQNWKRPHAYQRAVMPMCVRENPPNREVTSGIMWLSDCPIRRTASPTRVAIAQVRYGVLRDVVLPNRRRISTASSIAASASSRRPTAPRSIDRLFKLDARREPSKPGLVGVDREAGRLVRAVPERVWHASADALAVPAAGQLTGIGSGSFGLPGRPRRVVRGSRGEGRRCPGRRCGQPYPPDFRRPHQSAPGGQRRGVITAMFLAAWSSSLSA